MSELRDPKLGSWVVFEGDTPKTNKEQALPWGGDRQEPVVWPVTLRVHRVTEDHTAEAVDVEVHADLTVTFKYDKFDYATGAVVEGWEPGKRLEPEADPLVRAGHPDWLNEDQLL